MARGERDRRLGSWTIPLASAVVLACILATFWITFDRVRSVLDTKDWVAHTYEVRAGLETVYGGVAAAESDVRAYLISKDAPSYDRFVSSEGRVQESIAEIARLTRDNASQGPRIARLREAVAFRYRAMHRTVDVRQGHDLDESLTILRSGARKGEGLRAMAEVRTSIEALASEERRLLLVRKERSLGQTFQAEVSFAFSLVIGVVLITAFGLLSNRLVVQREAAADEERALRAEVEAENERTKAAEARLEATMIDLRRSNEELQSFAFVASHDLQEPLRKIRAFSDRVRRRAGDALDDESKDSLRRVEAAADRMQRLILDLLELSRITTKVRPRATIDLGEVIDQVADDLQTRLEEGGRVVYSPLPTIFADPAQIRQLFQNLIANALKFRREGVSPKVTIEARPRSDGRILIEVRDNGVGFEEKYAERIFVVFQRLHGRGEYEGSGIGLAIVRKIVERHGGTIVAEGTPGEGATFRFDLPGGTAATGNAAVESGEAE